ncbi:replication endonuclease [Dickeya ananatis]|uniref:replication endonuclease n=1 Tax=Dickeya ananatis TaxID=3061286 RepID=UPI00388D4F61
MSQGWAYSWNKPLHAIGTAAAEPPAAVTYNHHLAPAERRQVLLFEMAQRDEQPNRVKALRRRLAALPHYVRRYYVQRVTEIEQKQGIRRANSYLINSFDRYVLPRLDAVSERYRLGVVPGLLMPFRDDFHRIPYAGRRDLKRLAARLTDCFTAEFQRESDHHLAASGDVEFSILYAYGRVAWLVSHLNMTAPGWFDYCQCRLTADAALRAMARLESAGWWLRRLVRVHDQWREHLMIAAGYVHKKATPYISEPALKEWQAQKKANREFLKSRELEDQDTGERSSLIDKVMGSVANPAIRRAELMTRMRGFEDIAVRDGLAGEFYTLTAPSSYHAMHSDGKRNQRYNGSDPRDTQRYLCRVWSRVRAKWKRQGIRVYGFRVAEPHHDETPHWHLLLFMRPEHVELARAIFRDYALREDGGEPGADKVRFTAKPIDYTKGSATGYIAKYISKNIDGYALDNETDDETGQPLKDSARRVSAWASRWRIRQFQQIGGAPVTTYRELRRLQGRDLWLHPVIAPAHIAADTGDWAGYTDAQGGPLVERRYLRVCLHYDITENGNDYGDDVSRISGVYAPVSGPESVIFTRTATYKIVPKTSVDAGLAVDLPGAPRPLGVLSITVRDGHQEVGEVAGGGPVATRSIDNDDCASCGTVMDFDRLSREERRDLLDRLVNSSGKRRRRGGDGADVYASEDDFVTQIRDSARSIGWDATAGEAARLSAGHSIEVRGRRYYARADGELYSGPESVAVDAADLMRRVAALRGLGGEPGS